MQQITEKQIVEWKAELDVQKQKKLQAEQALDEITRAILMIEGGIQFGQLALKENEKEVQPQDTTETKPQSKTTPSK